MVVIGIEPEKWIIDSYPPESDAPKVTAATINNARMKRGKPPVPDIGEEEASLAIADLMQIAKRIARG